MKIPKYVKNILSRSVFAYGAFSPGYTILIEKESAQTQVKTFAAELERFRKWCERQIPHDEFSVPVAVIEHIPPKTVYKKQFAIMTIYDPVMRQIEKYIKK